MRLSNRELAITFACMLAPLPVAYLAAQVLPVGSVFLVTVAGAVIIAWNTAREEKKP